MGKRDFDLELLRALYAAQLEEGRPVTSHEISRRMAERRGPLGQPWRWIFGPAPLYPAFGTLWASLSRLEREGVIASRLVETGDGEHPQRRVYKLVSLWAWLR